MFNITQSMSEQEILQVVHSSLAIPGMIIVYIVLSILFLLIFLKKEKSASNNL